VFADQLKALPYFRDLEPQVMERIRGCVFEVQPGSRHASQSRVEVVWEPRWTPDRVTLEGT